MITTAYRSAIGGTNDAAPRNGQQAIRLNTGQLIGNMTATVGGLRGRLQVLTPVALLLFWQDHAVRTRATVPRQTESAFLAKFGTATSQYSGLCSFFLGDNWSSRFGGSASYDESPKDK
jgi:hypothetical protein